MIEKSGNALKKASQKTVNIMNWLFTESFWSKFVISDQLVITFQLEISDYLAISGKDCLSDRRTSFFVNKSCWEKVMILEQCVKVWNNVSTWVLHHVQMSHNHKNAIIFLQCTTVIPISTKRQRADRSLWKFIAFTAEKYSWGKNLHTVLSKFMILWKLWKGCILTWKYF